MTAEAVAAPSPAKTSNFVSQRTSSFTRIWPAAAVGVALLMTMAWMGLLGYGLFKLAEPAFFWSIS
jgi:hypothetical protein